MSKLKHKIVTGMDVVLITGDSEYRGKKFTVSSIDGNHVTLNGYRKLKKFIKPNPEQGNENFKLIDKRVHISNIAAADSNGKASKVGFKIEGEVKTKIYKTTGLQIVTEFKKQPKDKK